MKMSELTDSDLLGVPGGAYAVLRRIRERVLTTTGGAPAFTPHTWHNLTPPRDPWSRPAWDEDTVYLQLLVTTG
jgi:hypothetical protein